ncbi:hypothetical protein D3C71_1255870 [compost metagenome]
MFEVAAIGYGLNGGHPQAGCVDCGGMRLLLLLRASQRRLRRIHASARALRFLDQRLVIGFVLLIATHLVLQQGQRLRGLRLFAAQAVKRLALFRHRRQPRACFSGLGLEVFPGFVGLGAFVLAAQFGQAVHVGVQLRHGLRAIVAFGGGARQGVFGVFIDALGAAVARIQQGGAFG